MNKFYGNKIFIILGMFLGFFLGKIVFYYSPLLWPSPQINKEYMEIVLNDSQKITTIAGDDHLKNALILFEYANISSWDLRQLTMPTSSHEYSKIPVSNYIEAALHEFRLEDKGGREYYDLMNIRYSDKHYLHCHCDDCLKYFTLETNRMLNQTDTSLK